MTIASTNVGFSTIAAEKDIGTSNLSLNTLATGQMKLPVPSDSSSTSSEYGTFDQTWFCVQLFELTQVYFEPNIQL